MSRPSSFCPKCGSPIQVVDQTVMTCAECDPRIYVLLTILGERVGLREWDPGKPIPSLATELFEKHRFVVDIPELDLRWPVAVWRRK